MIYQVYCDGSTRGNGRENAVGAWAYVIINGQYNTISAGDAQAVAGTTNQRMELHAAIEGITKAILVTMVPRPFGKMCLNMILASLAPRVLAARTYSWFLKR